MQGKRARELGMTSCDEVTRGRENEVEDNSRTMKKSTEVLRIWQTYLLILLLSCDAERKQAQHI
jgi:hypothetical protein